MSKTTAEYHDGLSSKVVQVELTFNDDGSIGINGEGIGKLCLLDDVSFSPRLGNIPRVINLPDGASCHVADNDLIDSFLKAQRRGAGSSFIHMLESRIIYVIAAVLFTALFSWGMVVHGVPYFSKKIAFNLPEEVDRQLGKGTLETMDRIMFSESQLDTHVQMRLLSRFDGMKTQIEGSQDYKMLFRHGNEIGANAFALPSGIIVVTDELVELSENDDEVIAILAHEIGHLIHRHSVRMVLQNSAVAVLIATITGDPFSSSSIVVALPTILVNANYSREFEVEADDYAYHYLLDSNMPLDSFANILERITGDDSEQGVENYLSTHPETSDRLQRFR
ncbi:MAG: M48 family metallopeptidase [Gammaproteobacteria bacterium]|nr:M48 family metallopeptidase [Gammaproteobacteria bacterium]MCW8923671.1 M48 family metallopeptidase [Gammaproteobacteria bacterium]